MRVVNWQKYVAQWKRPLSLLPYETALAHCATLPRRPSMTRFQFVRARLVAPPRGLTALGWLVAAVVAPTLLRLTIDPWVIGTTFVAYFPFVLLAALFLGSRSAMLATVGSAVAANFLFMEPRYIFFAGLKDSAGALLFVISSLLMIAVAETLRRTVQEARGHPRT